MNLHAGRDRLTTNVLRYQFLELILTANRIVFRDYLWDRWWDLWWDRLWAIYDTIFGTVFWDRLWDLWWDRFSGPFMGPFMRLFSGPFFETVFRFIILKGSILFLKQLDVCCCQPLAKGIHVTWSSKPLYHEWLRVGLLNVVAVRLLRPAQTLSTWRRRSGWRFWQNLQGLPDVPGMHQTRLWPEDDSAIFILLRSGTVSIPLSKRPRAQYGSAMGPVRMRCETG